ncbi:MAG: hypothetical protein ACFCVE_00995 [Phycisphaerae bacterium]
MKQHEVNGASRPRRVRRDARQWRALLAEHDGCGLPTAEFCRTRDVAAASFYHWRRLLRAGDDRGGDAPQAGGVGRSPQAVPRAVPQVVRLEADTVDVDDTAVDPAVVVAVVVAELPGGVRVTAPARCLRELLDGLLGRGAGGEASC